MITCKSALARASQTEEGEPVVALALGTWRPGYLDAAAVVELSAINARELARLLLVAADGCEVQAARNDEVSFDNERKVWLAIQEGRSEERVATEFGVGRFRVSQIRRKFDRVKEGTACAHTFEEIRAMADDTPMFVLTHNIRLSERLRNCLRNEILWETLGDLRKQKDHQLARTPGLGEKSIGELRAFVPRPSESLSA